MSAEQKSSIGLKVIIKGRISGPIAKTDRTIKGKLPAKNWKYPIKQYNYKVKTLQGLIGLRIYH